MEPLITIETVPISIEYVERKPTCSSVRQLEEMRIAKQDDQMRIQKQPVAIPMQDTYEPGAAPDSNNRTYTAAAKFSEIKTPMLKNIDARILSPGRELKVVERPKLIIRYIGDPLYVPKSSDPKYVAPKTKESTQNVESNFNAIA